MAANQGTARLCDLYRDQFPVTEHLIYVNHAGVAPLCRPAAEAIKELTDDCLHFGSYHYHKWLDAYEGLRDAAATLIGAHRDEIATVKNTSEGIATIALGIQWRPGDKIVAFREEFPANYYIWSRLEARGVRVEWLSAQDSLATIEAAAQGARLLTISFVQYLSGFRADLEAIGQICHRHGVFFFVDAIQGLGVLPLNVERMHIDALAADGHKWLLGPEGCGLLYVRKRRQDEVEPVEFGWTTVAKYNDYASRDMILRPDAGRYECGTLNTVGIYGLRASIRFLLKVGVEQVGEAVLDLADQIYAGAKARGFEMLHTERTRNTGSGIVTFRRPGEDCRVTVRQLKDAGVMAAPRQGWVRVSPHFYQTAEEMDHILDALSSARGTETVADHECLG